MQQLESDGVKMYCLLNYIPSILYTIGLVMGVKLDVGAYIVLYFFAQPLYLLIVNIPLINKKIVSYVSGMIYMFSVIVLNALITMIMHKIQTGYFLGDVPEGIYYLMIGIPSLIIMTGIGIVFLIKK